MNQPQQSQPVQLQPEQVQAAARAGVKLLTDDERVNVPPSLSLDGSFAILVSILNALASGQAVMGNPLPPVPADGAAEASQEE